MREIKIRKIHSYFVFLIYGIVPQTKCIDYPILALLGMDLSWRFTTWAAELEIKFSFCNQELLSTTISIGQSTFQWLPLCVEVSVRIKMFSLKIIFPGSGNQRR